MSRFPSFGGLILGLSVAGVTPAFALTMDQAQAQCREQAGPTVRACVRQKMIANGGSPDQYIPACRAAAVPKVRACIAKLIGAAGFKQLPTEVAAPVTEKPVQSPTALRGQLLPPRTIADITAILDREKPDFARLKKLHEAADATEPPKSDPVSQAHFYFSRAVARGELGRFREAVDDGESALALAAGRVDQLVINNFRTTVALQYLAAGEPKQGLAQFQKTVEDGESGKQKGFLFNAYRQIARIHLLLGDFQRAETYVKKVQDLWKKASKIPGFADHGTSWEANVESSKATLFEARGELGEAVRFYQRAEALRRKGIERSANAMIRVPRNQLEEAADLLLLAQAGAKARIGRIAEAESDARRALLNRLRATGKFNPTTARFISSLGMLLVEQGRYEEATKLITATIAIYGEIGVAEDSQTVVRALTQLASIQALEGRWREAGETYASVERATESWEPGRRNVVLLSHGRIETLFKTGKIDEGMAAAQRLYEIRRERYGEQHLDTALARGHYAVGLKRAQRDAEARAEFQAAIAQLTSTTFNTDNDDTVNAAARTRYTQVVVETYIGMLAGDRDMADTAFEAFRLADTIRGRSVQKALTASGARMSTTDPALAAAVRQEQDLRQQIGTQLGQLNALLALPAAERDDAGVAALRNQIEKMRAEHAQVRTDIERRFPDYADLIDPKPPTLEQVRETLRLDEALLSFYFGREASFVWAIGKSGPVEFAPLPDSANTIDEKIRRLREALEPQAATIADIPPFDVALAHDLYKSLLEPVRNGWQDSKSLIVVTNGALGLLPLSLLTTAPYDPPSDESAFSGYRAAPWLIRTHAVSMVPSASALRTLRRLPPGSDKREKLIAFGDPFFGEQQAEETPEAAVQVADAAAVTTRGIPLRRRSSPQTRGVNSADLAQLPRLPDTADELRSIALALEADPTKALHLGKEANEQKVKKTNLSGFKIVAFATHGLVPGEIDGLTQPALALSAPQVAGVEGDGLLLMEEILSLKLDADWVVLSACNTGAAAGAGAEAASGLGRAFFYAGTRAILVTNWSVHSQSARELVTDLFRRQAADPKLTRAEALQQAMLALLEGKGFTDDKGATVFSYAHPLFWAPYTIIGDSGGS